MAVSGPARGDDRARRWAAHRAADLRRRAGWAARTSCTRWTGRRARPAARTARQRHGMIRFALHCGTTTASRAGSRTGDVRPAGGEGGDRLPGLRRQHGPQGDDGAGGGPLGRRARRAAPEPAPSSPGAPAQTPDHVKAAVMVAMLRKMREHVEKNFENVGERFPEEARRIHYGEADARDLRPGDARGGQGAARGGHPGAAAAGPAQARRLISRALRRGRRQQVVDAQDPGSARSCRVRRRSRCR